MDGDWVEIFKGGVQTDSSGLMRHGDRLIDKAVATFNVTEHQPPLVIGHPENDAPAYGWVEALRKVVKNGRSILEARFGQVQPEFKKWVRQGLYKTRSAGFYPNGRLRHVGFLGAVPPAVKGLGPVNFAGEEVLAFEIHEGSGASGWMEVGSMDLKEFFENMKAFFGLAREAGLEPPALMPQTPEKQMGPVYSEEARPAGSNTERLEYEAKIRQKLEKEYQDKLTRAAEEAKAETRKEELSVQVDALVKEGRLAPALAEKLKKVLALTDQGENMEFAEGVSGSPADWLLYELENSEKSGLFSEIAQRGRAGERTEFIEARTDAELGRRIANRGRTPEGGK